MLLKLKQLICFHEYYQKCESKHVFLKCIKCEHETPGFTLGKFKRRKVIQKNVIQMKKRA